jgi:hypothetical protein
MRRIPNLLLWLTDPTPAGLFLYLTILTALTAAVFVFSRSAPAETPAAVSDDLAVTERVEKAIVHLCRDNASHPASRLPYWRRDLAEAISETAETHDIPPLLITAIAFRESSLRTQVIGERGERGLLQVHGRAAMGCDLETAAGQLDCGASWLRHCVDICGSLDGGYSLYASGRTCTPDTRHLRSVVADRWRLWARLEKL